MRIFISSLFKDLLEIDQSCLELGYFRLGSLDGIRDNNGKFIENLNDLRVSYIEQDKRRSPTSGVYTFDGVIFKNENKIIASIKIPTGDQGMSDNEYKVIYGIYKNLLTGNSGIAFVIAGDKEFEDKDLFIESVNIFGEPTKIFNSLPLCLSYESNIITFPIPDYSCTLLVRQDDLDLVFLEDSGVGKNYNMYRYFESHPNKAIDRNFITKNSFDSYYRTTRCEDDFTHNNTVYINKFGIKIY
jgi:hypothetical protein